MYLGGRHVAPEIMTPYDLAAVRLEDGLVLAGDAPEATGRYLDALRGGATAAAPGPDGAMATAAALGPLVEQLTGLRWEEALDRARALGGLVGAYPAETGPLE